jgi:hypothetical protein
MTSNAPEVLSGIKAQLLEVQHMNLRAVALEALALLHWRLFNSTRGARDKYGRTLGGRQGNYSPDYMKKRLQKKYRRTKDTKIVLSLTSHMEQTITAIPLGNGVWGIGWTGSGVVDREGNSNYKKSLDLEALYRTAIFELSDEELQKVIMSVNQEVNNILS